MSDLGFSALRPLAFAASHESSRLLPRITCISGQWLDLELCSGLGRESFWPHPLPDSLSWPRGFAIWVHPGGGLGLMLSAKPGTAGWPRIAGSRRAGCGFWIRLGLSGKVFPRFPAFPIREFGPIRPRPLAMDWNPLGHAPLSTPVWRMRPANRPGRPAAQSHFRLIFPALAVRSRFSRLF